MLERIAVRRAWLFALCLVLLWGLEWFAVSRIAHAVHFGSTRTEDIDIRVLVGMPLVFGFGVFAIAAAGTWINARFLSHRVRAALLVLASLPVAALVPRTAAIGLCYATRFGYGMPVTRAFSPNVWLYDFAMVAPTLGVGLLASLGVAVLARFAGPRRVLVLIAIAGLVTSSLGAVRALRSAQPTDYFASLHPTSKAQVFMPTDPHALRSIESVFVFRIAGREYFTYQSYSCIRPPLALRTDPPDGWPEHWTPNPFWDEPVPTLYAGARGAPGLFIGERTFTLFDVVSLSSRSMELEAIAPAIATPWIWLASAAFASVAGLLVVARERARRETSRLSEHGPYRGIAVDPRRNVTVSEAAELRCTAALCFVALACAPLVGAWGTGVLW